MNKKDMIKKIRNTVELQIALDDMEAKVKTLQKENQKLKQKLSKVIARKN